ncbi:hypothetical protein C8F01DRAFT_1142372 [Mycena amicta]|nr:hypothetical protein C8F01DRAFT_1142372 [Mycena amicta]
MHNSEASENWDDDFEFQSNPSSTRQRHRPRPRDGDGLPHHDTHIHNHENDQSQNTHRQQPRHRDSQSTTENWDDDFAEEDGEAAPAHQQSSSTDSHSHSHSPMSSPTDPHPPNAPSSSQSSFALPPPPPARPSRVRDPERTRHRDRTPRASKIRVRAGSSSTAVNPPAHAQWGESSDEDLEADELGFGDEEDRTVTARTGRRALSHTLNTGSPPPPVPPLPPSASVGRRGVPLHMSIPTTDSLGTMPFPRSPTTSVFSAPDNASIAYTHTSAGSTTHLRPSSRSGKKDKEAAKGLAGLPPSPPIHRERERRRLRKKSRPQGTSNGQATTVEMREIHRASSEDGVAGVTEEEIEDWDADLEREAEIHQQPHHPYGTNAPGSSAQVNNSHARLPSQSQSRNASASASTSQVALPASSGLLARIGSVKRWGGGGVLGRRKKSSSVSVASESLGDPELEVIADIHAHSQYHRQPSSLLRTGSESSSHSRHSYAAPSSSSSPAPPGPTRSGVRHSHYAGQDVVDTFASPRTPPRPTAATPQSSSGTNASGSRGWFFRSGSGSPAERERGRFRVAGTRAAERDRGGGGGAGGVGRDGSPAGAEVIRDRPYTPSPTGETESKGADGKETTKLVKRRSLGFVQIRKGLRPLNGGGPEDDNKEHLTPTPGTSAPTPGKTPTAKNPNAGGTPNASPSKGYGILGVGRPPASSGSVEDLGRQEKEKEGMGFIERNVRRISLVGGRHRRTKSGVSLSGLPVSVLPASDPTPPDVQLEPPSPPQTVRSPSGASALTMTMPIDIGSPPRTDGLPLAFSPTFSIGSSNPGSLILNSPISLASSSTPSLTPYSGASSSTLPSPKSPLAPHPHSASLGRSAAVNIPVGGNAHAAGGIDAMRRNSLGDLKIPARISQAQHGLRRDLGMVREFARNVEELKELQATYQALVSEVQGLLDTHVLNPPAKDDSARVSPTFFRRHRSNTSSSNPNAPSPLVQQQLAYKQLAAAFYTINSKYRISWECAELLIELGGGASTTSSSPPTTSASAPAMQNVTGSDGKIKARERAITLTDEGKALPLATSSSSTGAVISPPIASPPSSAWRASTGRNDLSQRQLLLLKEMLGTPSPTLPGDESFSSDGIPEEASGSPTVDREWRWGDAMNSTVTLPSEESGVQGGDKPKGKEKKRRSSRLRMSGIRDMLKALKKGSGSSSTTPPPVPVSSTSVSTESSSGEPPPSAHLYEHGRVPTPGRRRAKTSVGPESIPSGSTRRPMSPYDPASIKTASASPRRPSLATIFRIGKTKTPPASASASALPTPDPVQQQFGFELYPTFSGISGGRGSASNSTGEDEEDWDRLEDSASDLEGSNGVVAQRGLSTSTIRGRSPYGVPSSFLAPAASRDRPTTPLRSPSGSRTSLNHDGPPTRATRLSNVEELPGVSMKSGISPSRQLSQSRSRRTGAGGNASGSVRSMPPVPDPAKLAMTPENIKPLLENAREVHARLTECILEIRGLLVVPPTEANV